MGTSTYTEFSVERSWESDRRNPSWWLISHTMRHWPYLVGIMLGAFGNALGAGLLVTFVGRGFDDIISGAGLAALATTALLLVGSQLIRGLLMLTRNFCSEVIGQRVERDTRDELYLSLIGKSMSYHDRQATGDLMARATNDVREINLLFNPGVNLVIGSMNFIIAPFILVPSIDARLAAWHPSIYVVFYAHSLVGLP